MLLSNALLSNTVYWLSAKSRETGDIAKNKETRVDQHDYTGFKEIYLFGRKVNG